MTHHPGTGLEAVLRNASDGARRYRSDVTAHGRDFRVAVPPASTVTHVELDEETILELARRILLRAGQETSGQLELLSA